MKIFDDGNESTKKKALNYFSLAASFSVLSPSPVSSSFFSDSQDEIKNESSLYVPWKKLHFLV